VYVCTFAICTYIEELIRKLHCLSSSGTILLKLIQEPLKQGRGGGVKIIACFLAQFWAVREPHLEAKILKECRKVQKMLENRSKLHCVLVIRL
jgi:hypothetical protein